MMAGEPGTSVKRADLEWRGVGWLLVLLRDMPDLLDREAEDALREALSLFGLIASDGSLTERGEEARRAALRLLAERKIAPCRVEALAGGDVARWAALADAATPGPWEYDPAVSEPESLRSIKAPEADGWCVAVDLNDEDGTFIAAARTAVPALCADNARLRAEVASLRAALADPQRALVQRIAEHAPAVHSDIVAAVEAQNPDGLTAELALEGREQPATTAEQDVDALRARANEHREAAGKPDTISPDWFDGVFIGINTALEVLAPYLPVVPRVRP